MPTFEDSVYTIKDYEAAEETFGFNWALQITYTRNIHFHQGFAFRRCSQQVLDCDLILSEFRRRLIGLSQQENDFMIKEKFDTILSMKILLMSECLWLCSKGEEWLY